LHGKEGEREVAKARRVKEVRGEVGPEADQG
jgi:hypothetical protein